MTAFFCGCQTQSASQTAVGSTPLEGEVDEVLEQIRAAGAAHVDPDQRPHAGLLAWEAAGVVAEAATVQGVRGKKH